MRVLAGGWEIDRRVFTDANPNVDRTPAPASEVERFKAEQTFHCSQYSAQISARQCAANRIRRLGLCPACSVTTGFEVQS